MTEQINEYSSTLSQLLQNAIDSLAKTLITVHRINGCTCNLSENIFDLTCANQHLAVCNKSDLEDLITQTNRTDVTFDTFEDLKETPFSIVRKEYLNKVLHSVIESSSQCYFDTERLMNAILDFGLRTDMIRITNEDFDDIFSEGEFYQTIEETPF